jgi:hypothetical protein
LEDMEEDLPVNVAARMEVDLEEAVRKEVVPN